MAKIRKRVDLGLPAQARFSSPHELAPRMMLATIRFGSQPLSRAASARSIQASLGPSRPYRSRSANRLRSNSLANYMDKVGEAH